MTAQSSRVFSPANATFPPPPMEIVLYLMPLMYYRQLAPKIELGSACWVHLEIWQFAFRDYKTVN